MSGQGFGSEQLWGLCPGIGCEQVPPGDGDLVFLFVDTGDLRYLYSNLAPLVSVLALGEPVKAEDDLSGQNQTQNDGKQRAHAQIVLYERLPHILARQLIRLALLTYMAVAPSLEEKIRVSHAYMEVHANLRLSDESLEMLDSAALVVQALMSPSLARGFTGERLDALNLLRKMLDLRTLLKSGDRDDIYATCAVYREEISKCRKAASNRSSGEPNDSTGFHTQDPASHPHIVRTSLSLVRHEEAPPPSLEESFDIRLRDYYGERYDVRENLSLWDLDIRLDKMLPFIPGIFFSSFRATGLGYLRPYFRLPQTLGATEPCGPVSRRAQTSEESRMYCRHSNPTFGSVDPRKKTLLGYRGDIVTGPWLEEMSDLYLAVRGRDDVEAIASGDCRRVYSVVRELAASGAPGRPGPEPAIELYRTFQNAGPDSHEGIFTGVEVAVVNLVICSGIIAALARDDRLSLLPATGQAFATAVGQRAALGRKVGAAFLSLEGIRLVDPPRLRSGQVRNSASMGAPSDGPGALIPCLAPGCRLFVELPEYVCQMDKEQVTAFTKHVEERAASEGFKILARRCVAPPFPQYLPTGWREAHPTHLELAYGD